LPGIELASFQVDGQERLAYEFGLGGPRPFFFPLIGPSGRMVTRMGHPNPGGHEHHRSIWFGHQKVQDINFWEERPGRDVRVRHKRVIAYRDGTDWAGLAAELDWWAEGKSRMTQALKVALTPCDDGGLLIDLESRFEAMGGPVDLGQTNFGFLGVRVAKTMSEQFGGGRLTADGSSKGGQAICGKRHRWADYSGPAAPGGVEGIAYLDHPSNPHHPTPWHVRSDGWFEAAFNLAEGWCIAADHPLSLRYRLWVHRGPSDVDAVEARWHDYGMVAPLEVFTDTDLHIPSLRRKG